VIPHPKAKLFVPFVDNAMMIVVDSEITFLFLLGHVKISVCKNGFLPSRP
jgi:hypothetical protein